MSPHVNFVTVSDFRHYDSVFGPPRLLFFFCGEEACLDQAIWNNCTLFSFYSLATHYLLKNGKAENSRNLTCLDRPTVLSYNFV